MPISLHTQTSALTPQRRLAYPRWTRQAPQKRNFPNPKPIFIRPSLDRIISALEAGVKPWSYPWLRVPGTQLRMRHVYAPTEVG